MIEVLEQSLEERAARVDASFAGFEFVYRVDETLANVDEPIQRGEPT